MKFNSSLLLLSAVITLNTSCKKEEQPVPEDPIINSTTTTIEAYKIGETYVPGTNAKIVVSASKALETGYNELSITVLDSTTGVQINDGNLKIVPIMDMGSMKHSCPTERSEGDLPSAGTFKSAIFFSMAGNASQWSLNFTFKNNKTGKTGQCNLGVPVVDQSPSLCKSITLPADSGKSILITLLQSKTPQVGINDFEIVLHQKASMMNYPSINNYSVEIIPEMPSMGHGSPNNVNPVNTNNGHYFGKVNYTMTGLWYVHLKLYKNGNLISSDQRFEITLH